MFSANQFGTVVVTFSGGTSGHSLDASNSLAVGTTITDSSTGSNIEDLRASVWTAYTPTWTASVDPTLGNGTLVGRYSRRGNLVVAALRLTWGSTTDAGTGAWYFSLPAIPSAALPQVGQAQFVDALEVVALLGVQDLLASSHNAASVSGLRAWKSRR